MNIGIDAKWYFNGHPSGKVVVQNIVDHIIKLDSTLNFFIFLDQKDRKAIFQIDQPNIHLVYVPNIFNAVTNLIIMPFYTMKYKIDVCLYQNYAPLFGAKKIVNYVHDALFMDYPDYFSLKERIYFYPMKYVSKKSDHVITISHSEKKRLIKHGFCKPDNISVVHHGLGLANDRKSNTDIFKKYNLPKRFILYLGRLNIRKNIQSLLRAMPYISEEISLVIVGKEDHKILDLDLMAKELNISERTINVGLIDFEDIRHFYVEAEVFCFPSSTSRL